MASLAITVLNGTTVEITYSSSGANWDVATDLGFEGGGIVCSAIKFHPSGNGDILVVHEGSTTGAEIIRWTADASAGATDDRVFYFQKPKLIHPFIPIGDQTFGTKANVRVIFELE